AVGYIILSLLHLWNSLPALLQGRPFPLLGGLPPFQSYHAVLEAVDLLTLSYLFAIYGLSLHYWSHFNLKARELVWALGILGALAWTALPANSSDVLMYIAYGRIAGVYGANPYLHTYAEISDSFSAYAWGNFPLPYGPVTLPLLMVAGRLSQLSVVGT